jgi:hypothetical protein
LARTLGKSTDWLKQLQNIPPKDALDILLELALQESSETRLGNVDRRLEAAIGRNHCPLSDSKIRPRFHPPLTAGFSGV